MVVVDVEEELFMPDIFQAIDELDTAAQQRVIDRLEFRGSYAPFVAMRDAYLDRLSLPPGARVCELGCGTGVVSRAIGARVGVDGTVLGSDLSRALVAEAQRRADAGRIGNVTFRADASGGSGEPDDSCDLVVLHTVISHVGETKPVLAEAARIAKQGAAVVVFDGDYASLTCHTGRASEDATVMSAILETIVANPHIMRDLPRLMREAGLSIHAAKGDVLLEVGEAEFFDSLIEAYVPMAVRADLLGAEEAEGWLTGFRETCAAEQFFGSCNYVTYFSQAA
jgi:ubiquinone/menaquinone biosynthesis C-methylase UbiE